METKMKRNVVSREANPVEKSAPQQPVAASLPPLQTGGWISFSYSRSEISQAGGTTHIRSQGCRFENGKLESETFAGTLDGSVYREAVERAQKLMLAQSAFVLGLFQAFLPRGPRDK
jgi:hypothetical protein